MPNRAGTFAQPISRMLTKHFRDSPHPRIYPRHTSDVKPDRARGEAGGGWKEDRFHELKLDIYLMRGPVNVRPRPTINVPAVCGAHLKDCQAV